MYVPSMVKVWLSLGLYGLFIKVWGSLWSWLGKHCLYGLKQQTLTVGWRQLQRVLIIHTTTRCCCQEMLIIGQCFKRIHEIV